MDAQDNLKIIHTVDGASLQNRYGKSVIQIHDIGLISLPTGEIVMADPTLRFEIADFKRKAFQQKVRPGMYPVFAYTAHSDGDCVLAFAEICFTDRPPVTFTAAKTLWDNMTTLELVLNMLAEATTTEISKQKEPVTFSENIETARAGGKVAGDARKAIEAQTGVPVITSKNAAQLSQVVVDMIEGNVAPSGEDADS